MTTMMTPDQYRIEKTRVAVTFRLMSGERMRGAIFVNPFIFHHVGQEEPLNLFNAQDPFFPIETEEGEVLLVAKDRLVEVEGVQLTDDDELRRASARPVTLTVTFVDGFVRTGCVYLEMPADRPRLLDFLNRYAERFFPLYVGDDVYLVNTRAIEHVRPRD